MNINYENLVVYHCKHNYEYSLDVIISIHKMFDDNDTLFITAIMCNNIKIAEWLINNTYITTLTIDKMFRKMCIDCNIEVLNIIVNKHSFKYSYTIDDHVIKGVINIVCKFTDKKYSDVCCICYEDTECYTNCFHELCLKCIDKVMSSTAKCPICIKNIEFCYVYKI